jgi:hypothetical protein
MARRLAVAFFLIGWFGAHGDLLLEEALDDNCDGCLQDPPGIERDSLVTAFGTACMAALVGAAIGGRRRKWTTRATLLPLLAGACNGAILSGVLLSDLPVVAFGLVVGFGYGVLYLVPAWLLGHAAFDLDRAASGSLVGRRSLWRWTLLVILVSAALRHFAGGAHTLAATLTGTKAAAALALAAAALLFLFDLKARRRLARLQGPWVRYAEDRHGPIAAFQDLGTGGELQVRVEPASDPYRQTERVTLAIRGDIGQAAQVLRNAAISDLLLMVVAISVWLIR